MAKIVNFKQWAEINKRTIRVSPRKAWANVFANNKDKRLLLEFGYAILQLNSVKREQFENFKQYINKE